jgi:sphingomyelin phosphodiesterase 2
MPLFVFLDAVVTWVCTTIFYVGFLYGRWEASVLKNVIEFLRTEGIKLKKRPLSLK